jgi:hypothetical protein
VLPVALDVVVLVLATLGLDVLPATERAQVSVSIDVRTLGWLSSLVLLAHVSSSRPRAIDITDLETVDHRIIFPPSPEIDKAGMVVGDAEHRTTTNR